MFCGINIELAPYRRMAAETEEMRQKLVRPKKVSDTHSKTEQAADQTSAESTTQSAKRERNRDYPYEERHRIVSNG